MLGALRLGFEQTENFNAKGIVPLHVGQVCMQFLAGQMDGLQAI
jgi:hypothetical protein